MGKVETYTQSAINIANDNRHGYSQYSRWGNPNTWSDFDCSSLVISVCEWAGIPVKTKGATYTGNMYGVFTKCGFKDVTSTINLSNGKGLQRGDILLNSYHHTEIYIGNGKTVGAKIDEYGDIVGANTGDQTGREICTGWYYNYPWTCVLRFVGDDKQVSQKTSLKSKPSGLIKTESWYGVTETVCNVRSAPSTKSSIVAQYGKGEKIYYDSVYEGDGYRWISYVSYSGVRRYVAYRQLSGDTTPWIRIA
ncbi:SH3 domain-containing protein [Anaerococcus tetradius]|uniref:SH3 domain-containing protein n=1 Tax=Anaerococcus tetradius TaxID=33036 RepID=UPI0023F3E09F|nr:SH3 domain-containing protein [Anaerococcus tetradius]